MRSWPIAQDLVQKHGLDREATRLAIQAMLDEQPAPLRGAPYEPAADGLLSAEK